MGPVMGPRLDTDLPVLAIPIGFILGVVAWLASPSGSSDRVAAPLLLAYIIAAATCEPFSYVWHTRGVLYSIACLSPLIVGGAILPGRGAWISAAGCWLVLFAGLATVEYNLYDHGSFKGLLFHARY